MSDLAFYFQVLQALEEIKAPYMIIGAFAGLAFGVNRSTFDIDIMVDLDENDFDALAARFPPPRYYADPEMMRNSTRMGIMFNLIDTEQGIKADLVPLSREPEYRAAFARRVRRTFQDESGQTFKPGVLNRQTLSSANCKRGLKGILPNTRPTSTPCWCLPLAASVQKR
jgi:hypothetical protein